MVFRFVFSIFLAKNCNLSYVVLNSFNMVPLADQPFRREHNVILQPWLSACSKVIAAAAPGIQDVAKLSGQASLWGTVYVLQFLQWWYQREHLLQPGRPRKAPPPPPRRFPYPDSTTSTGQRLVVLPEDATICPLCHRQRQNPAMSCGGYAFCYTCLVPHVREFGHCPITGQRMRLEEIRRIRDEG